jgi:hypothetical protein
MPRALGRDQQQTLMTAHGSKYRFQIRMVKDRMVKEKIAQIVVGGADVFHGCCAAVLEGFCQLCFRRSPAGGTKKLGRLRLVAAKRHPLENHFIFPFDRIALRGRCRRGHDLLRTRPKIVDSGTVMCSATSATDQRSGAGLKVHLFSESPEMDFRNLSRVVGKLFSADSRSSEVS